MRLNQLDDVLFPVEEHPVFVMVRDQSGERRLPAPHRKAIVNVASQRVLGIVSRDYRLVTNHQALDVGVRLLPQRLSGYRGRRVGRQRRRTARPPADTAGLTWCTARRGSTSGTSVPPNGRTHSGRSFESPTATTGSARSHSISVSTGRSARNGLHRPGHDRSVQVRASAAEPGHGDPVRGGARAAREAPGRSCPTNSGR